MAKSKSKSKEFKVTAPPGYRRGGRFSTSPSFDENGEPVVVSVQFDENLEAIVDEQTADKIRQHVEFKVEEVTS